MSQVLCTNCHRTNRLGAKFCGGCGSLLPSQPSGFGTGLLPTNSIVNNRYIIIRKIGQGGMGAVYQVTDTQDGHRVLALKEMSDSAVDPPDRPQMVAQFQQEAILLQRLNHANLPYVTDKFSIGDRHYLVMEYINGRTLQQMLDDTQQPFPEPLVLHWTDQLCDVLGYLHNQNPKIIFRDLKPDNIMITTDNQVKLIDFGIVRFFKPGKKKDTILLGTKGYAAPEQWGAGQTDERSDVYSLGVTLFHLLTAVDPESYVLNIPNVRQFNPSISPQTEQLVSKATRPNTQERFASMQQMRQALPARIRSGQSTFPVRSYTPSNQPQSSQVKSTARPTTRLVQATLRLTAQWTNQQLITAGAAMLAVILLGAWIITPRIQETWFWYNIPTIAILGPAIFAATRRQGVAGIGHGVTAALAGSLTWYRAGISWDYTGLFVGALVSAIAIEAVLHFLPQITTGLKRDDPDTWKKEAAWLGIGAVAGHIFLTGFAFNFNSAFRFASLVFAFLLGGAGWFVGDLIYSAWNEKQSRP
jgi:serine/threonine protein kinase, bacterial